MESGAFSKQQLARMLKGKNPEGYVVHHINPLMHGGTNEFSNLVLIRKKFHQKKFGELHTPGSKTIPAKFRGSAMF